MTGLHAETIPETVTAVYSNVLDLAFKVGAGLDETDTNPSITFLKGACEMHAEPREQAKAGEDGVPLNPNGTPKKKKLYRGQVYYE